MLLGSLCVVLSLMTIGYVRTWGYHLGLEQFPDETVTSTHKSSSFCILLAVAAFYVLDFAINAVQASCRSLMVDVLPSEQQRYGTSWASAMIGAGNVLGYFLYVA